MTRKLVDRRLELEDEVDRTPLKDVIPILQKYLEQYPGAVVNVYGPLAYEGAFDLMYKSEETDGEYDWRLRQEKLERQRAKEAQEKAERDAEYKAKLRALKNEYGKGLFD
jgi:hypothetical protein